MVMLPPTAPDLPLKISGTASKPIVQHGPSEVALVGQWSLASAAKPAIGRNQFDGAEAVRAIQRRAA